ncbi:MAG TPA: peptide chain release factor N(5)-glutamine methyltransferase [Thermoanaerobaculia bacterium]|nr:peptide chain release factor N(5)-glutamine methyltransferase [Thermoanaerobaculia bacterium]
MANERLDDLRARLREDALARGINPRDVDLLLSDALEKPLAWLYSHGEFELDADRIEAPLQRRYAGEPLQYIRGKQEFYSRDFVVDDRVLIPRPETELIVETAIERAPRGARVVDIGTGSGCIAISIECERTDLRVTGVDASVEALAVAKLNRDRLDSRVTFAASDLFDGIRGMFDLIVSNPPYVPRGEYEQLATEVRVHEPQMALTPGPRGTEIIERLLDQSHARLAPHGLVIMEVGYGQEDAIREIAEAKRYEVESFLPDLAGIPRVVVLSAHGW